MITLSSRLGTRVVAHGEVESTMIEAEKDGGERPVIHVARTQSGGRGRRGRSWVSPAGNLYATVVWPDPAQGLGPATLAGLQVACATAIRSAGGPAAQCKWPNDGFLNGEKWSGTIARRRMGPEASELHVGFGANLEEVPPGVPNATALRIHWPDGPKHNDLVAILLDAVVTLLRGGEQAVSEALAGWHPLDALEEGAPITVKTESGSHRGRYGGVSADGQLFLLTSSDDMTFSSGDVIELGISFDRASRS